MIRRVVVAAACASTLLLGPPPAHADAAEFLLTLLSQRRGVEMAVDLGFLTESQGKKLEASKYEASAVQGAARQVERRLLRVASRGGESLASSEAWGAMMGFGLGHSGEITEVLASATSAASQAMGSAVNEARAVLTDKGFQRELLRGLVQAGDRASQSTEQARLDPRAQLRRRIERIVEMAGPPVLEELRRAEESARSKRTAALARVFRGVLRARPDLTESLSGTAEEQAERVARAIAALSERPESMRSALGAFAVTHPKETAALNSAASRSKRATVQVAMDLLTNETLRKLARDFREEVLAPALRAEAQQRRQTGKGTAQARGEDAPQKRGSRIASWLLGMVGMGGRERVARLAAQSAQARPPSATERLRSNWAGWRFMRRSVAQQVKR